jgi:maltose O-acetyltransferase
MRLPPRIQRHVFAHVMYLDRIVQGVLDLLPPPLRWIWYRSRCASFGHGVLVDYGTYIRYPSRVHIGDDVSINRDCRIYPSFLIKGAMIRIEDGAVIAPGVTLFGAGQDAADPDLGDVAADIVIGRGAYIGGNSTIRYGVHIGEGAVVAAGAVVVADVAPWTIVGGVPARAIAQRPAGRA